MEKICDTHKKKSEYLCLDSNCESENYLCIICLKKNHIICDQNLILSKLDLKNIKKIDKKISLKKKSEKIFEEIEKIFEEKTEGIFADLKFLLNKNVDNVKYFKEDLLNYNKISELKKNYDIEKKNNLFFFYSRIMNKNLNLDKSFRLLKNSLKSLILKFIENLKNLQIENNNRKISILDFIMKKKINFFFENSKFIFIPEKINEETEIFFDLGKNSSFFYKLEIFRKSEIDENDKRDKIKIGICRENNITKKKNEKNFENENEIWKIKNISSNDIIYLTLNKFRRNPIVKFSKKQNLDKNIKNQIYYLNYIYNQNSFFIYDQNFELILKSELTNYDFQIYPFFSFTSDDYYVTITQNI